MSMTISGNVSGGQSTNSTADPNKQIEKLDKQVDQDSSKLIGIATSAASAGSGGGAAGAAGAAGGVTQATTNQTNNVNINGSDNNVSTSSAAITTANGGH